MKHVQLQITLAVNIFLKQKPII